VLIDLGSVPLVAYRSFEVGLEDGNLMGAHENSSTGLEKVVFVLGRLRVGDLEMLLEQYVEMRYGLCLNCYSPAAHVALVGLFGFVAAAPINAVVYLDYCPPPSQPHSDFDCSRWSRNFLVEDLLLGYMDPMWYMSFHRTRQS
jgi:hypothetical protein